MSFLMFVLSYSCEMDPKMIFKENYVTEYLCLQICFISQLMRRYPHMFTFFVSLSILGFALFIPNAIITILFWYIYLFWFISKAELQGAMKRETETLPLFCFCAFCFFTSQLISNAGSALTQSKSQEIQPFLLCVTGTQGLRPSSNCFLKRITTEPDLKWSSWDQNSSHMWCQGYRWKLTCTIILAP